jgi:hypothetical protein
MWAQSPYEKGKADARVEWAESEQGYFSDRRVVVLTGGKDHSKLIYFTDQTEWTSASVDTYLTTTNIIHMRKLGFKQMSFVDEPKAGKKRVFASFDLDPKKKR